MCLLLEWPPILGLDLLFSCTNREKIIKATLEWIRTTTVAGYHGSRLIDLEVDSIRSLGLLPLEAPARRERLVRALSCHPRWNEEALDAAVLKYGEGNRAGRREGQVSLTLSRCGLLHGFNHYLAHGSEFDQHVAYALLGDERKELLRRDGKARIIQVAVPGDIALNRAKGVSTSLDHTLHVGVGPRTPSHEPTVRHRIDLYGVLKQAVEQQSARS